MSGKLHPQSLLSAVAYGAVAVAANFTNKSAMLTLPFAPNTVLLVQLAAMFCTAQALRCSGLLPFPAFSSARCWQLLPLSLAYAAHASLVLRSLLYLNVAMYNTLKRMTPVLVLTFKAIYERKAPSVQEVACVLLIVSGCIVAGAGDLNYSLAGYATALVCAALQAVYILLAEANERAQYTASKQKGRTVSPPGEKAMATLPPGHKAGGPEDAVAVATAPGYGHTNADTEAAEVYRPLMGGPSDEQSVAAASVQPQRQHSAPPAALANLSSSAEVLFYTSLSAMPVLAAAVVVSREAEVLPRVLDVLQQHWTNGTVTTGTTNSPQSLGGPWGGGAASVAWALAVAWSETALAGTLVWCTECNSGLTTSIVGVLKGVVAVVLGFIFMAGPAKVTLLNVVGVAMVLLGGCWYSSLKCLRRPSSHVRA